MPESLDRVRERLELELRSEAERIQKLEHGLQEAARQHKQLERSVQEQLQALQVQPSAAAAAVVSLGWLLAAVQNLAKATSLEGVFATLAEEAHQAGARSAIFSLRDQTAWCCSTRGFKRDEQILRSLVIPLGSNDCFQNVYETGAAVETKAAALGSRELLDAFEPPERAAILLLPIRTAGSVGAVLYCDWGEDGPLPVEALKILAEFASAQLDRLPATSTAAQPQPVAAPRGPAEAAAEAETATVPAAADELKTQPKEELASTAATSAVEEPVPATQAAESGVTAGESAPARAAINLDQLSGVDRRVHKDAERFSRLLISEIELYNKTKVAEGRKNHDLFQRLKSDIERSRQTYQKRFGSTVAKQVDYFHEELVRSLAQGDPSLLGSDYPGPKV